MVVKVKSQKYSEENAERKVPIKWQIQSSNTSNELIVDHRKYVPKQYSLFADKVKTMRYSEKD